MKGFGVIAARRYNPHARPVHRDASTRLIERRHEELRERIRLSTVFSKGPEDADRGRVVTANESLDAVSRRCLCARPTRHENRESGETGADSHGRGSAGAAIPRPRHGRLNRPDLCRCEGGIHVVGFNLRNL